MTDSTDFAVVISDLETAGVTRAQIAREVDVGKSTIQDLAEGKSKQPRFDTGMRLLHLHALHVHPKQRKRAANQG